MVVQLLTQSDRRSCSVIKLTEEVLSAAMNSGAAVARHGNGPVFIKATSQAKRRKS
jgi:hypothetical protein